MKFSPEALFPCYIFSRFQAGLKKVILTVPGVQEIVNNGHSPIPVDEKDMEVIRRLMLDSQSTRPYPIPAVGQRVQVHYGAFTGVEGTLVRVKNESRIVLSVQLLQRSVITELDENHVTFL